MLATSLRSSAEALITALLMPDTDADVRASAFDDLVSRPVTAELLTECVQVLRRSMVPVQLSSDAMDTCGTGGSGLATINTSTLTAFIVAAAGGKVAKHGNRSASGNCGCFDLLEELGVRIDLQPAQEQTIFEKFGITFLFAPLHHPALRFVVPLRKIHGKKTLFNLLGPLCNPASIARQMLGTGHQPDAPLLAETLRLLGTQQSIIVRGHDGLDEVTVTTATTVLRVTGEKIRKTEFIPGSLSVSLTAAHEITGGTVKDNARIFLDLAQGGGNEAMRNLVLVNAAHALTLTPLVKTLSEAFALASEVLCSGKVLSLFTSYRDFSNSF